MRTFRLVDGALVDAGLPEFIGDLVFVGIEPPLAFSAARDSKPENADYFVVDKSGAYWATDNHYFNPTNWIKRISPFYKNEFLQNRCYGMNPW
jgi:hypothetical protein